MKRRTNMVTPIINAQLDGIKDALDLIAVAQAGSINVLSEKGIQQIVRAGLAQKFFNYGNQIEQTWKQDDTEAHEYDMPMDVVAFHDAEDQLGSTGPGLWLQSHWVLPGIQYDASEAIWACKEVLPAGIYHFTIGQNWGTHVVAGKTYQFTLETEIPVGGQIVIGTASSFYTWGAPDVAVSTWRVYTFSDPKSVTPLDGPLELSEGSAGTDLGTLGNAAKYTDEGGALNNIQRAAYGYNRWSQSAVRQWMNSDKPAGEWWEPQNPFDRPPQQLATLRGMLAGMDESFLEIVQPVKVVTALNTITDGDIGTTEITYDRFFLASLEQEYIVPQLNGAEGPYWPYWKERLGLSSPQTTGSAGANAKHIRYAIENHTSAQTTRLRSAYRGFGYCVWYVSSTGYAGSIGTTATTAYRLVPACVIM